MFFVRVANKGLMLDATSRASTFGELNTETQSTQRLETGTGLEIGAGREVGLAAIIRHGTTDFDYCQGLLLSGIIRMTPWKPRICKELAGVNWFDNGMEECGEARA